VFLHTANGEALLLNHDNGRSKPTLRVVRGRTEETARKEQEDADRAFEESFIPPRIEDYVIVENPEASDPQHRWEVRVRHDKGLIFFQRYSRGKGDLPTVNSWPSRQSAEAWVEDHLCSVEQEYEGYLTRRGRQPEFEAYLERTGRKRPLANSEGPAPGRW
jgi:hypothetical protein